ncbi:hypothetical protein [Marinobacter sp. LQ44]|uniref:hypothetical protein n=1 Tax=Marinobacter sp. LQ44 TaxID=1749259 RepID=UPI000718E1C2|nr:hypothetical protein [Marinobacter sp. LQ44]AMQ87351.1 hypothetical protein ASQ50_00865 [Marinobacter sp. LQ44]
MSRLEELQAKADKLERDLFTARGEADAWNSGKYKGHSNATLSKRLVESMEKQLSETLEEIRQLEQ